MLLMIEFSEKFVLPEMILTLSNKGQNRDDAFLDNPDGKFIIEACGKILHFEYKNINPKPVVFENNNFFSVCIGSPILNDSIAGNEVFSTLLNEQGKPIDDKITLLNGEFVIISFSKSDASFFVINDRFTAYPFFYNFNEQTNSFLASLYFSSLWKFLKKSNLLKIDKNAFFEFFWLQRLLGTKTYDTNTSFLQDASVLVLQNSKLDVRQYWTRDYSKSSKSLSKHAQMMAEMTRQSVIRKTSDNSRYGIFLSGGMDSRTVLCAFDSVLPICFTSTISENREFRKAREIAGAKGAEHIGLRLHSKHFGKIFRHSTEVIGGMYNYDHGLFYGFNDAVRGKADVCFHGHGFDYMFQGMYIPKNNIKIAGRYLYANFMKPLPDDLISFFINNVSYRIKRADIWKYITSDMKSSLKDFQHTSIQEILDRGKKLTDNPNDLWEYLTFHHLSRHYSFPNHASIATFAEQRTVSFDNDLFDLYLSLPASHRVNGKIEKKCLKILNPEIASIWSANTNLPVTASCWTQTLYQLAGFVKRRFIPEEEKPEWMERTWPERHDAIRSDDILKQEVRALCSDNSCLNSLGFLDMKKLENDIIPWLDGKNVDGVSGDLVQTLITMYTFLKL